MDDFQCNDPINFFLLILGTLSLACIKHHYISREVPFLGPATDKEKIK